MEILNGYIFKYTITGDFIRHPYNGTFEEDQSFRFNTLVQDYLSPTLMRKVTITESKNINKEDPFWHSNPITGFAIKPKSWCRLVLDVHSHHGIIGDQKGTNWEIKYDDITVIVSPLLIEVNLQYFFVINLLIIVFVIYRV